MNLHNYKQQSAVGKAALILTYPFAIGVHWSEWRRMKQLQYLIKRWIPVACKNPKGYEAECVTEWSEELREIYGK